jgi:hypothetical protein
MISRALEAKVSVQLLLFVIAIILLSIFWVLAKINSLLKRTLVIGKDRDRERVMADHA